MSKRDHITDEDRALFRRAAGGVRRIEDDRSPPVRRGTTPRSRERVPYGPSSSRGLTESEWTSDIGPGDVLSFARGGVRRREIERLRRGRFSSRSGPRSARADRGRRRCRPRSLSGGLPPPRAALRAHRPRQGIRVPERSPDHEGACRPVAAGPPRGARVLLRDAAGRRYRSALRAAQALTRLRSDRRGTSGTAGGVPGSLAENLAQLER